MLRNTIFFMFIIFTMLTISACDVQKENQATGNSQEATQAVITKKSNSNELAPTSVQEFSRQQINDTGKDNWKLEVCKLWKKNDCTSTDSDACKYWEKSTTHLGMTPEICVQAMNATLQQCKTNQSFFQFNQRDCQCIEEQYQKTTHRPNTSNKEGPLFASECFIKK